MVTQIQPVARLQRMDEQRQLKEILTAVIGSNVQLGRVLPNGFLGTGDGFALCALHVHFKIGARAAGQHAVERAHLRLFALPRYAGLAACLIGEAFDRVLVPRARLHERNIARDIGTRHSFSLRKLRRSGSRAVTDANLPSV